MFLLVRHATVETKLEEHRPAKDESHAGEVPVMETLVTKRRHLENSEDNVQDETTTGRLKDAAPVGSSGPLRYWKALEGVGFHSPADRADG